MFGRTDMFRLNTAAAVERKALARRERIKSIKAVPKRINTPANMLGVVPNARGVAAAAKMDYTSKIADRFSIYTKGVWGCEHHSLFKGPQRADIYFY